MIRTCIGSGGFTRPTGDLGLQLNRRTNHVEAMAPPYVRFATQCSPTRLRRYCAGSGGGSIGAVTAESAFADPKRSVAVTSTLRVEPESASTGV